ncbi:MAG: hypothetical protein ACFFDT_37800 [Candidatus Hodarchaeota archaeon]
MLKELFVIHVGNLIFHYSPEKSASFSDKAILSGGLLSAINSFIRDARSDIVDSFQTEHEYFLFSKLGKTDRVLIGVFERPDPVKIAKMVIDKIHPLITESKIIEDLVISTDDPEIAMLEKKIELVTTQLFGTEGEGIYIKELLEERGDIQIGILADVVEKKEIAHFARPTPLYKKEQCQKALLLYSNLLQVLSRLKLAESFSYFSVSSKDYVVVGCLSGKLYGIVTGVLQVPETQVLQVGANMCHHETINDLVNLYGTEQIRNKSIFQTNGTIFHQDGEKLLSTSGILLSTLINNIGSLFKSLTRKNFSNFKVVISEKDKIQLKLNRKEFSDDFDLEIVHFV